MSDNSTRLNLPFLQPAQAQKHVTHNEALVLLDALVQTSVVAFGLDAPPASVNDGDIFAVGDNPTGDWTGQPKALAVQSGGGWVFVNPQDGWRAWDSTQGQLMVFTAGDWVAFSGDLNNLDGVGIGTGWDTTNRLAVASDASLFTHAGSNHQIKVNKAASGDTASLLFQTGWTGHAEMGLAGDNAWSIKVSSDGSIWDQPLTVDPATQIITANYPIAGTSVQQTADDTTPGRLMRADWGYGPGNLIGQVSQTGGAPTGAVIERGEGPNGSFVRWADGTQMCWWSFMLAFDLDRRLLADWTFPVSFGGTGYPVVMANLENEWGTLVPPEALVGPVARQRPATLRTEASIRLYRMDTAPDFGTLDQLPAHAFAIGRWY